MYWLLEILLLWTWGCVHFQTKVFVFPRYMPRNKITGSYGNFVFSFLRNLHSVLHSGCINLHSHQQFERVLFSLHPLLPSIYYLQTFCQCPFWLVWYLIVILTCISLIINSIDCLFMCLLPICISSLEKCLLRSFITFFLIGLFFLYWGLWPFVYFGN